MKFAIDHDLHIHTFLSACSRNPEQNPARILQYAQENGLKKVCITDHFWDEDQGSGAPCYGEENLFEKKAMLGTLPEKEGIQLLFGVETELNREMKLGLSRAHFDVLDFVVIPTTHLNMMGLTLTKTEGDSTQKRADLWLKRVDAVLSQDLPFHKIGLAHLTCRTMAYWSKATELEIYKKLPEPEVIRLMQGAAQLGIGIELNACSMMYAPEEADIILKIYRIAKECGCKFYLGSDSHHPPDFIRAPQMFQKAVDALDLTENHKFPFAVL